MFKVEATTKFSSRSPDMLTPKPGMILNVIPGFTFTIMQIFALPNKNKLKYLDVQYFNNEAKRGVSAHVIKVQFRTVNQRDSKLQSFIIPVTNEARNINRNAKKHLGDENGLLIKQHSKDMTKRGIPHFFGFRQVTITEKNKMKGGPALFHRKQDPETMCWALVVSDEEVKVNIFWAGEWISVMVKLHKNGNIPGQSVGIGYWDFKAELRNNIERVKNATEITTGDEDNQNLGASERAVEYSQSSQENGTGLPGSQGREESGCDGSCDNDGLDAIDRFAESSGLGVFPETQMARETSEIQNIPEAVERIANGRTGLRADEVLAQIRQGGRLDQSSHSVWDDSYIYRSAIGLGSTFRLPANL